MAKSYGKMRDFKVVMRVVTHDQILGVQGYPTFRLKEGDSLEVLEIDVYHRGLVRLHGQELWLWAKMIDQVSKSVD